MVKKIVIAALALIILIIASVFVYRYQILQYSAESIIRKYLPDYIKISVIKFDFVKGDVILGGFRIVNPPHFSKEYLIEIEKIECRYKLRGKNIMDGIEISSPVLSNAVLNIERLGDGRINLVEVQAMIAGAPAGAPGIAQVSPQADKTPAQPGKNNLRAIATLPETFKIRNAQVRIIDRLVRPTPTMITLEDINTDLTLKLDQSYTRALEIGSIGAGVVGGDPTQVVNWTVRFNPTTPRLTMSSRFDVAGVIIPQFEPYYDRYSPFVFREGRFSGLLIFDFDNGMIGSSDELRLSDLRFFVKPGYENAQFWQTTVPDLVKYFSTPYGEIVFDFKIKGDMAKPEFFLGPKSKEALVSMAVDKISEVIGKQAEASGNSDLKKAKDYVDLFRGLINK